MKNEKLFLKQNVVAEPLFNQWYAWSYLIAPAQSAMYVSNSHLKIMQSFLTAPQAHASALKNPANLGGPFINYDASRVGEIRVLMEKTKKQSARLLEFAEGIKTLDALLKARADGFSLEPVYKEMPDGLKGYVELTYDLNNNPSMRFIEGLLYKSPFYDVRAQSMGLSLLDERERRPFAFSTPKLEDANWLHLNLPFCSSAYDELFNMKTEPQTLNYIGDMLGVEGDNENFASFFTREAARQSCGYSGGGVRIRYFGHACLLIESASVNILCDPLINYKQGGEIPNYTFADLPDRINYLIITHNHQDHCMFETLLQIRHKVEQVIVPKNNGGGLSDPSLKLVLQNIGFKQVIEVEELEAIKVKGGNIISLPFLGEHGDLNIRTKSAYLVELNEKTILVGADSNNIVPQLYDHIADLFGDLDVLLLGMECDGAPMSWVYAPLLTAPLSRRMDQSRRFDGSDYEKAIGIVNRMNPARVYVYAMGQEPWLTYLTSIQYVDTSRPIVESNKFIDACRSQGREAERLFGCKEIILN